MVVSGSWSSLGHEGTIGALSRFGASQGAVYAMLYIWTRIFGFCCWLVIDVASPCECILKLHLLVALVRFFSPHLFLQNCTITRTLCLRLVYCSVFYLYALM